MFLMGAAAFQLFGGGRDRSLEQWRADEERYRIALKAINPNKEDRYQSIDEYIEAWTHENEYFITEVM
ncbi:hypothetical protein NNL21_02490 [Paenibacillus mendelii]|uniref:Uncharacterized protein n=1 Tax=Paenibacillus mendelii TaxID=206163 RepID=A0ABV6JFI7_9BACL|nr:hypothetical protein [Paenibacillus mendelii]